MRLKHYVIIWLLISAWLGFEYLAMNHMIARPGLLSRAHVNPEPGKPLSFALGWTGFGVICLTNLYILRKRLPAMKLSGNIGNWLDFHIFCGLLGPVLICFHCNFVVKGLVAISFWSMMISFASGVIGRYIYTQLLEQKSELKTHLQTLNDGFKKLQQVAKPPLTDSALRSLKDKAFAYAGGTAAIVEGRADPLTVFFGSIFGDLRLMVSHPPLPKGVSRSINRPLKEYARAKRRLHAGTYYRNAMGYWHTFHMPFAVFMYIVSVIHIFAALIFRVN